MTNKNNSHTVKTIENLPRLVGRKNFFAKLGKGFAGLILASSFPFNLSGRNTSSFKVEIKINPLAVNRGKESNKNG